MLQSFIDVTSILLKGVFFLFKIYIISETVRAKHSHFIYGDLNRSK